MSKKILTTIIILAIISAISGCDNYSDNGIETIESQEFKANIRTVAEAMADAQNFIDLENHHSRNHKYLKEISEVTIITSNSHLSRSGIDTLIYAFDLEDEDGFVLVAAPKNLSPILAFTEKGSFNDPKTTSNLGFQYTFAAAKDYTKANVNFDSIVKRPTLYMFKDSLVRNIKQDPRVKVCWGQSYPENIYTPNGIAGCTPLAIAQAMTFFEYPTSISYTFPNKDISSESLNWTDIKKHSISNLGKIPENNIINLHNIAYGCNENRHKTIGRIVRQIGHLAGTSYGTMASGTSFSGALHAIKSLMSKYSISSGNGINNVFNAMNNGYGVQIMFGVDSAYGGHTWIADATWDIIRWDLVIDPVPQLPGDTSERCPEGKIISKTEHRSQYLHYNWGWDGNCNGWFSIKIFSPGATAATYDNPNANNTSPYNFSNNIEYIHIK